MKESKEPTVKEVEKVKFYIDENGETAAIGVPLKIKTMRGGKAGVSFKLLEGAGGEIKGEAFSEIDYHWIFLKHGELTPGEVSTFTKAVTIASGTIALSTQTAVTNPPLPYYQFNNCPECDQPVLVDSKYCSQCGASLS